MSLINDALKRARVSALRQEAEGGGVNYRAVPAHSRRDSRSVVQLAGWGVAVVAIGLVLWMALRPAPAGEAPGPSPPAASQVSEPASAPPTLVTPPAAEPQAGTAATSPAIEKAVERAAETAPQAPVAAPQPAAPETTTPPPASPPAVAAPSRKETSSPPSPPPAARSGGRLEEGQVYLRRAASADGSVVELGGIAFSEDRPIAMINGTVASTGDMIAGFIVLRIEADRVWLEADGVRIYLALH